MIIFILFSLQCYLSLFTDHVDGKHVLQFPDFTLSTILLCIPFIFLLLLPGYSPFSDKHGLSHQNITFLHVIFCHICFHIV